MGTVLEITGKVFGNLTVMRRAGSTNPATGKGRKSLWFCQCTCGRSVTVLGHNLKSGRTKSCGVCPYETHGLTDHPLYGVYKGMKRRCRKKNYNGYKNYGGRGIVVEESFSTFEKFYAWAIGNGYKPGLTIERKDNNGNYSSENCTWVTRLKQSHNRRTTKLTEEDVLKIRKAASEGSLQQKEIAELFGVSRQTISNIHTRRVWNQI